MTTDVDNTPWPRVIVFVIAMIAIFATHYIWHASWTALSSTRPGFYIFSWVFTVIAAVFFIYSIVQLADPNKDWTFLVGVAFAFIAIAWNAGWCAQYKSDKEQGITSTYILKSKTTDYVPTSVCNSCYVLRGQPDC